ncbi:hypothetical protein [Streptomyces sp. NPDC088847]|uniref:hypothetical protein n=1 Tax=Streptomyces sp. NPDC088847 TaxID=3365909 RepID=UPI00381C0D50
MGRTTRMGTKKRAAVAASVSGLTGAAVGLTASHYGLDPMESTKLGCWISGAVGNLLFQAFRLSSDSGPVTGSASEETDGTANETAPASGKTENTSAAAALDSINVVDGSVDTGNRSAMPAPDGGSPPSPKHPKHRMRHRAAHRRIERRQGHSTF